MTESHYSLLMLTLGYNPPFEQDRLLRIESSWVTMSTPLKVKAKHAVLFNILQAHWKLFLLHAPNPQHKEGKMKIKVKSLQRWIQVTASLLKQVFFHILLKRNELH